MTPTLPTATSSGDVPTPAASPALAEAARLVREAVRDKSYQLTPIGADAAGYLRAKRKRLTDSSYRDYECCLSGEDRTLRKPGDVRRPSPRHLIATAPRLQASPVGRFCFGYPALCLTSPLGATDSLHAYRTTSVSASIRLDEGIL